MKKLIFGALALGVVAAANATVLFDAGGFEAYTNGNLIGQNGWAIDGTANYQVQNMIGNPNKAVRVDGGATAWAYPALNYTPSSTDIIRIEGSIARNLGATAATSSFGYSIDVYNAAFARTTRFGLVSVSGTIRPYVTARYNTTTQQFDPSAAATSVLIGGAVAADTFVHFDARLNYTTKRMDLLVNGVSVTGGYTIPFANLLAADLADADFQVSSVAGATDRGFLDNYKVQVVPEPGSILALGLGAVALLRRRKA